MKFLGKGLQKLDHKQDRQAHTDRHTQSDVTESITTLPQEIETTEFHCDITFEMHNRSVLC